MKKNADQPCAGAREADQAATVLIVDDDPWVRDLETQLLLSHGFKVLQAEKATDALALAGETSVDILVTDFAMPETNGMELARQFTAAHPGTPVLMVSGTLPELIEKPKDLAPFAMLPKSSMFALVKMVRSMLQNALPQGRLTAAAA